jgi:hypothetical protein
MRRVIATAIVVVLLPSLVAAADRRKYEDGPLTKDDFGEIPAFVPAGASARTVTELLYNYHYKYRSNSRSTTITLSSIEINAYIRRDQSWNRNLDNEALLDHEQGHADIAQIECLRARLAFRERLRKGRPIEVTASSLKEAETALQREVKREMDKYEQAAREADAEYDRATSHGLNGQQAEWRRVQQETLKKLQAECGKRGNDK